MFAIQYRCPQCITVVPNVRSAVQMSAMSTVLYICDVQDVRYFRNVRDGRDVRKHPGLFVGKTRFHKQRKCNITKNLGTTGVCCPDTSEYVRYLTNLLASVMTRSKQKSLMTHCTKLMQRSKTIISSLRDFILGISRESCYH